MPIRAAAYVLSWILGLIALGHIIPVLVALRFQESFALAGFIQSFTFIAFLAGVLLFATRATKIGYDRRTALNTLILVLVVAPMACGAPFLTTGALTTFQHAYFEGMSGMTTTGASVLPAHETVAKSVLVWRVMIEWFGGFSFLVAASTLLPLIGVAGINHASIVLPHGEGAGLLDRIRASFHMLGQTYLSVTVVFAMALWISGLPFLDGLTLAMTALATGGFTLQAHGLSGYGSVLAEIIVAAALLTGALNITLIRSAARGRFDRLWYDRESRTFFKTILTSMLVLAALFLFERHTKDVNFWEQLFLSLSMLTTSGIAVHEKITLPLSISIVLILLTIFGGTMISTSGGIKMLRVHILSRFSAKELARLAHPHGIFPIQIRHQQINLNEMLSIWALFLSFVLCAAFGALLFSFYGFSFLGAMKFSIAFLTSTGPLPHIIDPGLASYSEMGIGALWGGVVLMLAGRLEILLLLLPFLRFFQGVR